MGGVQGIPLAGRYRLLSVAGRGGMGTVWRAHDETLDRPVAVKEVRLPARLGDAGRRALCRRVIGEARATAALRHRGVLTVYDVVVEDDRPWIVVELLAARSLQEIIDRDGPLPPARAAEIGRSVLSVLRAAHAAGIVHRDVKPSNVLIAEDGRIVLTDFGLAVRAADAPLPGCPRDADSCDADSTEHSTERIGTIEGSPGYASPEQASGRPITAASDLWSLGATLYAAVEGRSPYMRSHALASLLAVLLGEYRTPAHAGPLRPLIDGLLRENPADRIPADRAAMMLKAVTEPRPRVAEPQRRARRIRVEAVVSVATLAAVVIAFGTWAARWNSIGSSDTGTLRPVMTLAFDGFDGPGGYSVRVPAGWRQETGEDGIVWADPVGGRRLRISPASGDPAASFRRAEDRAVSAGAYPGYRRLRIESVPGMAGNATEWEFTWQRRHALHSRIGGYELSFDAPDSRWTPSQRVFDTVLQTFRPPR